MWKEIFHAPLSSEAIQHYQFISSTSFVPVETRLIHNDKCKEMELPLTFTASIQVGYRSSQPDMGYEYSARQQNPKRVTKN